MWQFYDLKGESNHKKIQGYDFYWTVYFKSQTRKPNLIKAIKQTKKYYM